MRSSGKSFTLILILIMVISSVSLFTAKPACGQVVPPPSGFNIPTPSVPVFTVQNVNSTSFKITIKNQPFTSFNLTITEITSTPTPTPTPPASGGVGGIPPVHIPVYLYYNIQVSNDTNSEWTELYSASSGYPMQSNSTTTVVPVEWVNGVAFFPSNSVFVGSEFSVEVEAIVGYIGRPSGSQILITPYVIYGESSGWSNPKTITLPLISSSPTPTATRSIPEFPTWMILPLFVTVILLSIMLIRRRIPKG